MSTPSPKPAIRGWLGIVLVATPVALLASAGTAAAKQRLRRGEGRNAKRVLCAGRHEEPSDDNRDDTSSGLGSAMLEWLPPRRLAAQAERLTRTHRGAQPPYDRSGESRP